MLIQDFLQKSADRFPDKIALIHNKQRLTYTEVEARANKLANALIKNGIKRGNRVVIYLPNSVESVISIFGILKASGIFVVINPTTKKDKLIYILNNCKAAALITSYSNVSIASDIQDAVPSLKLTVFCTKKKNFYPGTRNISRL